MPKVADRPHLITILLTILATSISAFGVWLNWRHLSHNPQLGKDAALQQIPTDKRPTLNQRQIEQGSIVLHVESGVLSVAFSPDGTQVASGDADGNIKVWSTNDHQCTLTRSVNGDHITVNVTYSIDGQLLGASSSGGISLFQVPTGQLQ